MCKMTGKVKSGSSPVNFPDGMLRVEDNVEVVHIIPWSAGTLVSCSVGRHSFLYLHVLQFWSKVKLLLGEAGKKADSTENALVLLTNLHSLLAKWSIYFDLDGNSKVLIEIRLTVFD